MIKYPRNISTIGRPNLVLSVVTNLVPLSQQDIDNGASPLEIFKPWACIGFNFSDSGRGIGGIGNIEYTKLDDLLMRTKAIMPEIIKQESLASTKKSVQGQAAEDVSIKISFLPNEIREHRGKSAMEIAEKCGAEAAMRASENLAAQAQKNPNYAKSNLKQAGALKTAAIVVAARQTACPDGRTVAELYSGNLKEALEYSSKMHKMQHPATKAARDLYDLIKADSSVIGLLNVKNTEEDSSDASNIVYPIYPKTVKTPNVKRVDANGLTDMYEMAITAHPQDKMPIHIMLKVTKGKPIEGRAVGAVEDKSVTPKIFNINLNTQEWNEIISRAIRERDMMESMLHSGYYAAAMRADNENFQMRQAAKKEAV